MPGTVGVAPGTITLQLEGPPMLLGAACPPDNIWPYMTPPRFQSGYMPGMVRPAASAGPQIAEPDNPYGTESTLMGLGAFPQVDPLKTRWDIVAMVGGGVLLAGVLIGALASR